MSVVVIRAPAKGADLALHNHADVRDGEVEASRAYLRRVLVAQGIAGGQFAHLERLRGARRFGTDAKTGEDSVVQHAPAKFPAVSASYAGSLCHG